ncbi:MAG: hypothetical protein OXG90_13940 [Gammaproteobacteria bacterium]|nr:hypothetical protein [Gammaproteobacteria bacterium]
MSHTQIIKRGAMLCALLALAPPPVLGQTPDESASREHFFPLIADGGGFQSWLFVTNVSDAANQCSLALRGPDLDPGIFRANDAVAPSGANATIDLSEAGASVVLAGAGAGALTFGHAKLNCVEPAAARIVLSLNDGGSPLSLATLESASPGTSFQFPALPRLGRLAMVFSSEAGLDAACAVELEGETGASLGGGNVSVPAGSTALRFLDELIPIPSGLEAGKVRVSCDRAVAAVALPLNGAVFTALRPVGLEDDAVRSSHILPLVQDGGGFRSQLILTNLAETANQCTIGLRGAGLDASRFAIPAGATAAGSSVSLAFAARGDQTSLPSTGEQALAYGYAAVECDGPVQARNLLTADAEGSLAGMVAVESAQSADGMEFPIAPELGRSALAINNDAAADVSCAVELRTKDETVASAGLFQIESHSTSIRFLDDLFAAPGGFPDETARLSCYGEITAASLLIADTVFAAIPPAISPVRTHPESARTIPDGNLRVLIARQLDKAPGAAIRPGELAELESLDARNAGIESLEGLQHAAGLTRLDLGPAPWDPQRGSLNGNRITDLSPILGLSNLTELNVSYNQLSSLILSELGQLGSLRILNLSVSQLSGQIPSELGQLTNLEELSLYSNQLSGSIPPELSQLSKLRRLSLGDNQLSGPIPSEIGQLGSLDYLWLGHNPLTGPIPPELGLLSNLELLNLELNELEEGIPKELGQLKNVRYLNLGFNRLSGPIPPEIGELDGVTQLLLGHNQLGGSIPEELGKLSNLWQLDLSDNRLTGPIPMELANLARLGRLELQVNDLDGGIPPALLDLCDDVSVRCAFPLQVLDRTIDSDGDGTVDFDDAFPYDATKTVDSDGDGIDDDNDPAPQDSAIGDLRIFKDNVITMPVSRNLPEIEGSDFPTFTQSLYEHFEDAFDLVMLFTNLGFGEVENSWGYIGAAYPVSNDIRGIGLDDFYVASYGSTGKLKRFIHMPFSRGPMLHEVMHTWANYAIPSAKGGHWGFSSVNGILGGFDSATLVNLGNGRYSAHWFGTFADSDHDNPRFYSDLELYLAGFIPASEVPDILYFEDGEWLSEGSLFTGTQQTMTMEDFIARHGERVPSWEESQKDFRAAAVLIYNEAEPPSYDRLATLSADIVEFSGTEPEPEHESNFHRATRGLGTIKMDGLADLIRQSAPASRPAAPLPPSYGAPPPPSHGRGHEHGHDHNHR